MTLTETATITKRFLRVFLIFGATFLILWIAFLIIYNNVIIPYQRSQIKPEKRFGALPKPSYPPTILSSASLTYSLDTKSGGLPSTFPKLMKIYFIPPSETTLLAPDRARQLAASLGFSYGPEILSAREYRFKDPAGGVLVVDLSTGNFSFKRVPSSKPDTPQDEFLADETKLTADFKSYLSQKGLLKTGLEEATMKVIYEGGNARTSNTTTVSLWPGPIDKYPLVTADPKIGLINAVATKFQDPASRYQSLHYTYYPVDKKTFSTYQLKPISQAFSELQQGAGIIVQNPPNQTKASITNVYLAYFLPESYNSFLEPVYVFESDNFTSYVPALTADSYAQ